MTLYEIYAAKTAYELALFTYDADRNAAIDLAIVAKAMDDKARAAHHQAMATYEASLFAYNNGPDERVKE